MGKNYRRQFLVGGASPLMVQNFIPGALYVAGFVKVRVQLRWTRNAAPVGNFVFLGSEDGLDFFPRDLRDATAFTVHALQHAVVSVIDGSVDIDGPGPPDATPGGFAVDILNPPAYLGLDYTAGSGGAGDTLVGTVGAV